MPINYADYPDDWLTVIRPRILERDGYRCKFCGLANHLLGWRIPRTDRFYTPEQWVGSHISADDVDVLVKVMEKRPKPWRIILTIAHLDHDLIDHSDNNLAALCQRCHLNHDRKTVTPKREQRRRYSKRKKQLPLPFLILP